MEVSTGQIPIVLIGCIAFSISIVMKFVSLNLEKKEKEVFVKKSINRNLALFLASNTNVLSAIGASGAAGILWS